MNSSRILPLPPEVAAKIKSSTSITHLNGVIVELVKNALDANAHTIFITVDYRRGGCIVEDDGNGILPAEFEPGGGLGKAHCTSKFHAETPVYGRRGLFLASLSSLALLTITSHHVQNSSTNTVIFHHSTPIARLTPAPTHQGLRFSDHGTRVTLNDLFGNMPVRVKNRALTLQKPDELERQWDELRQLLVAFMIPNSHLLKMVVSDVDKERKLVIRPRSQNPQLSKELDLARLNSILSQAGLVDIQSGNRWHAVSASVPHLSIYAALSLVPSPSKKIQFISLGIDPVFPRNQTNVLFSEVNRLFVSSDFGTTGNFSALNAGAVSLDTRKDGLVAYTKAIPKAVNKWPMFYICINTNDPPISSDDQDLPESDRSLQRILDVLTVMVNEFLKEHSLRPRGGKRKRKELIVEDELELNKAKNMADGVRAISSTEETLGKRLKLPSLSRRGVSPHFGNWSRIKSATSHSNRATSYGTPKEISAQVSGNTSRPHSPGALAPFPKSNPSKVLDTTVDDSSFKPPWQSKSYDPQDGNNKPETDTMIPWIDPHTGISHWINSRTGQSVNLRSSAARDLVSRPRSTGSLGTMQALDSLKRPASAILDRTNNSWVENLLDNWQNPAFSRSEQPINALEIDTGQPITLSHYNSAKLCGLEGFGVSKFRGKLRKQDLATAEVIGQVDRKFILIRMATVARDLHDGTLVLIDQHAADERCRVEGLFKELFHGTGELRCIQTIQIDPIVSDIPVSEASLFKRYTEFFKRWGVEYSIGSSTQSDKTCVTVSRLPILIAERCRTEPDLVTSFIRREIWGQEENRSIRTRSPSGLGTKENGGWVGPLAGCPQGILDLLNSRACRTAIMFNDVLSMEECQGLVRRLASCVFPFQCAHGRPSMVPMLDLHGFLSRDQPDEYARTNGGEGVGFADAFNRWQSST